MFSRSVMSMFSRMKNPADIFRRTFDSEGRAQGQQQLDETCPVFRAPEREIELRPDFEGRFKIGHVVARLDVVDGAGGGARPKRQIDPLGIEMLPRMPCRSALKKSPL